MWNKFCVIVAGRSTKKRCNACDEIITPGELKVTPYLSSRVSGWHLDCFQPDFPATIRNFRNVEIEEEARKHMETIENWIASWNQQIISQQAPMLPVFFRNTVRVAKTDNKRVLLVCFSYLTSSELEMCAGLVCKEWHTVSKEDEAWIGLLERDFRAQSPLKPYRSRYIEYTFQACWHCKQIVSSDHIMMICPMSHKPLCDKCYDNKECWPISRKELRNYYKIKAKLIDFLGIPRFCFGDIECFYFPHVREKVTNYRQQRKQWLIEMLENDPSPLYSPEDIEIVRTLNINLRSFWEDYYGTKESLAFKLIANSEDVSEEYQQLHKKFDRYLKEITR